MGHVRAVGSSHPAASLIQPLWPASEPHTCPGTDSFLFPHPRWQDRPSAWRGGFRPSFPPTPELGVVPGWVSLRVVPSLALLPLGALASPTLPEEGG